jgi:hypothetical protein
MYANLAWAKVWLPIRLSPGLTEVTYQVLIRPVYANFLPNVAKRESRPQEPSKLYF